MMNMKKNQYNRRLWYWMPLSTILPAISRRNQLPRENYWQTLSYNVVSSTTRHEWDSNSQLLLWYAQAVVNPTTKQSWPRRSLRWCDSKRINIRLWFSCWTNIWMRMVFLLNKYIYVLVFLLSEYINEVYSKRKMLRVQQENHTHSYIR
jgi:hypothetical protein